MQHSVNQEVVNDNARLIMHRLIARMLAHDPSLVEQVKQAQARNAMRFAGRMFVREWDELLACPISHLRLQLTSRAPTMTRLRISSPFVTADGIEFTEPTLRRRIWRAAKRLTGRAVKSDDRRRLGIHSAV